MAIPGLGSGPAIMASTVETVLISCSEYAIRWGIEQYIVSQLPRTREPSDAGRLARGFSHSAPLPHAISQVRLCQATAPV
jgi:hypothetical protein